MRIFGELQLERMACGETGSPCREAQTWPYGIDHNGFMGANALGIVKSCALKSEVRCRHNSRFTPVHAEKKRRLDDVTPAAALPTF
jgi:hypothetical protein